MSTQQDIYATGSKNRPPMLSKDNYVSWSSRIIWYARSRPNGKMIVDSIENGPYVRRMVAILGEPDLPVLVLKSFHEQTNKELTENDIKRMDTDDQAIQIILLGLPEDVYAVVDSCETAKEIWERDEVNELRAERCTKTHDPLALMAHSQNSYNFSVTHNDQSSSSAHLQQSFPINNKYNPQLSLNQNFMQPPMTSLKYINDPTKEMNATLILFAKAFQLTAPTNNNQRTSSNPRNRQIAQLVVPRIANQNGTGNIVAVRAKDTGNGNQARCYNCRGLGHIAKNCTTRQRRRDAAYLQTQLLIAQKEEAGIQLQAEEFDFMVAAGDLDEIEEVNANCILMANLQHTFTSGTQLDKAPVYDTDGSAEVELFLSNVSNMATVSKTISIPNEDLSDDTSPSVARKFLNEVKNSLVTLQRVVKQKMTLEVHNWLSSAHKEVHKIISYEIATIINQVDAMVQNFKIQFLQEAAKFVRDFKSLAKEADESLDKQNSLELKIEWFLKASVSHDIMSIVQNSFVDVLYDLQTELDRTK
nr:hypothetical protein [Tanacetum cinerariifolium]